MYDEYTLMHGRVAAGSEVDIPKDMQFHEIIVPTADTVRNQFLLRTLVESNYHVLISGPTGTAQGGERISV